jgi:hypothetical protein
MNESEEFEIESYKLKKSGALRKNGAGIIDAFLVIITQTILFHYFPKLWNATKFVNPSGLMLINVFLMFTMYRFLTIIAFGKTIGMATLNMKFAKQNESQLSFKEKLLSVLMIYTNSVDCYHVE